MTDDLPYTGTGFEVRSQSICICAATRPRGVGLASVEAVEPVARARVIPSSVAINNLSNMCRVRPEFTAAEDAAVDPCPVAHADTDRPGGWKAAEALDFATQRIDGLSQWVDDYPVMLISANAAPDRKQLDPRTNSATSCCIPPTPRENMETEAPPSRGFLMPEARFGPGRRLDLGKLSNCKQEWASR